MKKRIISVLAMLGILLGFGACVMDEPTDEDLGKDDLGDEGKEDAWNWQNDPDRFQQTFVYRLSELPQSGEAEQLPWPGYYWPYYTDSINYRWNSGQPSSAEMYDLAFNSWQMPEGFMDLRPQDGRSSEWDPEYYASLGPLASDVHQRRGNARATNGRDDDNDGEIDETDDYDGIETWWGICHAWTPAAIMEPEPVHPVTYNGQTFLPSDIKGLLMITYDSSRASMLGGRCNDKEVVRGEDGRATDSECQDVNAGAFHVVITNMLGLQRRAFAEDRTYNYEVWNQPIRAYEITSLRTNLTAAEAMSVLGGTGDTYRYNSEAVSFAEVRMNVQYITESYPDTEPLVPQIDRYTRTDRYHYILELDANGDIIGGEWGPTSQSNHPDFLWLPTGHGTNFRSISYDNVQMLLDMSRQDPDSGGGDGEGQTHEVEANLAIPDNDANGVVSTLEISGSGTISGLQVRVNITHTYVGDLTVALRRNGNEVVLHNRQGGSADDLLTTFSVSDFDGQDIGGTWQLVVKDTARADTGVLNSWALTAVTGGGGGSSDSFRYSSSGAVAIPDNDANGVSSVIAVPDSGTIRTLTVRVNIEHTWIGDLMVEVRHNGATRVLHNRSGRSDDNIQADF